MNASTNIGFDYWRCSEFLQKWYDFLSSKHLESEILSLFEKMEFALNTKNVICYTIWVQIFFIQTNSQYKKRILSFPLSFHLSLDTPISRSSFASLRPKYVRYKSTLPHRVCVCVVHENVNLLLQVLSKEVRGLKNTLSDYSRQMVCDESKEQCMPKSFQKENHEEYS